MLAANHFYSQHLEIAKRKAAPVARRGFWVIKTSLSYLTYWTRAAWKLIPVTLVPLTTTFVEAGVYVWSSFIGLK